MLQINVKKQQSEILNLECAHLFCYYFNSQSIIIN